MATKPGDVSGGLRCTRRALAWGRAWTRLVPLVIATASGCTGRACDSPAGEVPSAPGGDEDAALRARLAAAVQARGPGYTPRTRHLNADGTPRFTNRLILESSPYLRQHAHNPVNWFPWGDEAFERARRLARPVFLSVGYSTCHWCHVMEEESFEDDEVARYLNDHYVCIKVDREERPDIDATYMGFVQALTGRGGWPMSVWLTPTREPFFGGTYFPPRAGVRGTREGFFEIARAQAERFASQPGAVTGQATSLAASLRATMAPGPPGDFPGTDRLSAAVEIAARRFDPSMGGSRGAPKFPSSFPLELLLRHARRRGETEPRRMALLTLDRMHEGGIHDHLGGGFHRYSTDAKWLVPHFEKMLYDSALLAPLYLQASQVSGEARYATVAREVLDYLLREMRAPDGTFLAATDADSLTSTGRREEGVFFTWTPAELVATLGDADARLAMAWFGVSAAGDVEGRSVLHKARDEAAVARDVSMGPEPLRERISDIRARLLDARGRRPPPIRDDKVIVAWNSLVVTALARAAIVLGDARYAEAAQRCATALIAEVRAGRTLPHQLVDGHPQGRAFGDDVALLGAALVDVFELTSDPRWLGDAESLMATLERDFADGTNGGYFLSASGHETLLLREKPDRDGPIPSVSSVAALTWLRLHTLTDQPRYRERAETTLRAFAPTLARQPLALDHLLHALDWATDSPKEIAIVVPAGRGALAVEARPLLAVLARTFVPNSVLVVASEADVEGEMSEHVPWVKGKRTRAGRPTAYVCERGTCQLPTTDPEVLARQLREARSYP